METFFLTYLSKKLLAEFLLLTKQNIKNAQKITNNKFVKISFLLSQKTKKNNQKCINA